MPIRLPAFSSTGVPLTLQPQRWPYALARALSRLLPSSCALCGAGCDAAVCAPCRQHYAAPRAGRCACCANPLPALAPERAGMEASAAWLPRAPVCGACLSNPPAFDASIAAVDYAAPLDQLVLQLKFGARLALAPWFAQLLRDAVVARPDAGLPDLLCPVPLGPRRLVERGFNQALEIARPLGASLGVPVYPRLAERMLDTAAQSGVTPAERARNVRGAFAIADPDAIAGRHVGLVDDVMTSGHTLDELAATCKRFGAARVTNLVVARTPPHA